MTTFSNPDWTFIINFFSIFLAVLSIILTRKFSFSKDFGIIFWNNSTSHEKIPDRTDLVRQIHKIQLTFQNHGKDVIYKNDFVDKINLDLQNASSIVKVVFESNCKYNKVNFENKNNSISFDFDFLESKKYLRVYVDYYSEEKIEGKITGKIIGGSEIDYKIETDNSADEYYIGKNKADAEFYVFPLITAVSFSLTMQIFMKMFKLDIDKITNTISLFNKDSFIIIFIVLIIALLSVLLGLVIKKLFIPLVVFARKEKNWYKK